jgi:hypothetical protein
MMGLDMYAYSVSKVGTDFEIPEGAEKTDIAYWRKHNMLHGWMEDLYRELGGSKEDFNCVPLLLTEERLLKLKAAIENETLAGRSGFFFGSTDYDYQGYMKENDLRFVNEALVIVQSGGAVYYDSWW